MKKHDEIIIGLVEAIEQSIEIGDWQVDGRCDPDMILAIAREYLGEKGFERNSIDNSFIEPL
jgi:hypothetical protein